jgi:hypothetical protein
MLDSSAALTPELINRMRNHWHGKQQHEAMLSSTLTTL